MIYLVGTNHELQHKAPPSRGNTKDVEHARKRFRTYLHNKASDLNVGLIAEELSDFILEVKSTQSIAKCVTVELRIEHRFCDPDPQTRTRLGLQLHGTEALPDAERQKCHAIRERYWFLAWYYGRKNASMVDANTR